MGLVHGRAFVPRAGLLDADRHAHHDRMIEQPVRQSLGEGLDQLDMPAIGKGPGLGGESLVVQGVFRRVDGVGLDLRLHVNHQRLATPSLAGVEADLRLDGQALHEQAQPLDGAPRQVRSGSRGRRRRNVKGGQGLRLPVRRPAPVR